MEKVIVVGANHAGTSLVNAILSLRDDMDVTVFDRNSNISFLGCGMALWIGGQIRGSEGLFYSDKEKLEAAGAKVNMETDITHIDYDKKVVTAVDKHGAVSTHNYDKLVLATGSLPIVPNVPGKDLENVQLIKLFQNAQEVIDKLQNKDIRNVAVVGAGYIGVEIAESLQLNGRNVTLIDNSNRCLQNYYDEPFTDLMAKQLMDNGVNIVYGETVTEICGDGKVEKVKTTKSEHKVDMVIFAVGFRPNSKLGEGTVETFANGAYIVDRHQETNIKDVYAIGDCATVYDNSIEDVNYIALATNAVRSGIVAAHNVCGKELKSEGVQGSNGISIYGLNMVSTGITVSKAEKRGLSVDYVELDDLQKPEFMETNNPMVKIRIVYDRTSRVIVGAQLASKYDISMAIHMFSLAIQEKVTIDKLKLLDIFFLPHFNKPYNYITMAALKA